MNRFNYFFRIAMAVVVFAWLMMGVGAYKAVTLINQSGGVRQALETVWCGTPGCTR